MARKHRSARTGRKRKTGDRYDSGRLKPQSGPAATPEMMEYRALLLGRGAALSDPCTALTSLRASGVLTWRQVEAGRRYRNAWLWWAMCMGMPARNPVSADVRPPSGVDPLDIEEIERADKARRALAAAVASFADMPAQRLVRAVLDSIVIEEWDPERWKQSICVPAAVDALTGALDRLANYFRIGAAVDVGKKAVAPVAQMG